MSVIPADQPVPRTTTSAAEPLGFWRRLARAVDEYFAKRSMRAVPATTLRRSRRDLARCRMLMQRPSETAPAAPIVAGPRSSP